MHRELEVWRRLRHPHILPLLGVVSDFGPYESMVCPWLENGSIAKHLERFGDILTISDRLNLVSKVSRPLFLAVSQNVYYRSWLKWPVAWNTVRTLVASLSNCTCGLTRSATQCIRSELSTET